MTDIFGSSSGLVGAVPLTDASGNTLGYVADAPGFYKLSGENISTLDFYLDPEGSRYMELLTISVTASDNVPLEADYIWIVNGVEKIKTLYDDRIESMNAEYECPTVYPNGEPIPHGTPHFLRVNVGVADSGTYEVYVCVMARTGTVVEEEEEEILPNNLDVTFAGIKLSTISEPEPLYDIPFSETELASGKNFVQASPEVKFSKTYICAPAPYSEKQAIIAMLGIPGDLVIDGVTYSSVYIKPPLSFIDLIPGAGKYMYTINFVRHTSPI